MARFQTIPPVVASGGMTAIPLAYQYFFGTGNVLPFYASGTFVVPAGVKRIRVRVHGAGGSGAGGGSAVSPNCTGGAGGGFSMKEIDVTPGDSHTVTVGLGGAQTNGTAIAGNAGGSSSFGAFCSATGGGGGRITTGATAAAAATPGTGTGGDVNRTGGASGPIIGSGNQHACATGGGSAAGPWGDGKSSGGISATSVSGRIATGGASISLASRSSVLEADGSAYGGAGLGGPPVGLAVNPGPSLFGLLPTGEGSDAGRAGSSFVPASAINRFLGDAITGGGGLAIAGASSGGNGGSGAGGGGSLQQGGNGGIFGGGGAGTNYSGYGYGGAGGIGAGGGGSCNMMTDYAAWGGRGGDGLVIVEW